MNLDKPIVILGAARSGTSLLGSVLSQHPELAYLEEPTPIWLYKNAKYKTDYLPEEFATNEIISYINERFEDFVNQSSKSRLLEKTPANTLRLPFVRKVLPNSKIIHVVRNGYEVAHSSEKKWTSEYDLNATRIHGEENNFRYFKKQVRKFSRIPTCDLIYYIGDVFRALLFHLGVYNRKIWGPRVPGLYELVKLHSKFEVCALQWKYCIDSVLETKNMIPESNFLQIKYEDFCTHPRSVLLVILTFCELEIPGNFETMVGLVDSPLKRKGHNDHRPEKTYDELDMKLKPVLRALGYTE